MSRRCRHTFLPRLVLLSVALSTIASAQKPAAERPELVDFDWRGEDVVLVFTDSVGYEIDLAASDTALVVLRLKNVAIAETLRRRAAGAEAPTGGLAISLQGRGGRTAALAQGTGGATSLHISDRRRLGFSVEWRPFTHQLVVHTFDWDRLDDAESQYHQGLIALEQGVFDQAEELLQLAGASGDERAHSVLASIYARRGEDSLARYYLRTPQSAEDYAALAAVQRRVRDSAAADESLARSERLLAERRGDPTRPRGRRNAAGGDDGAPSDDGSGGFRDSDVVLLTAIGGLALLLIVGLAVLATRRTKRDELPAPSVPPPPPPPPPVRPAPTGFRVVDPATPAPPAHGAAPPPETAPASVVAATPAPAAAPSATAPYEAVGDDVRDAQQAGADETRGAEPPLAAPATPPGAAPASTASTWASSSGGRRVQPDQPNDERPSTHDEAHGSSLRPRSDAIDTDATRPREDESTIDAARRMRVSRDNVELRRRMDAAGGRETNVPD